MSARVRVLPSVLAVLALTGAGLVAPSAAAAATSSLSGTVTGPDGAPLAGICVQVVPLQDGLSEEVTTDAQGRWTVDGLSRGDHVVGFNACEERSQEFAPEYFDDVPTPDQAEPIALTGTSSRTGVDAVLARTGAITGFVFDDDSGDAVEGVCVRALGETFASFGEDRTDEGGIYRIEGLTAGEHLLVFEDCSAPFTYAGELYDDMPLPTGNGELPEEPTTVTVVSGEQTDRTDAGLAEGGAITGTVTAAHTGRPVILVCVGVHPADDPTSEAVTGAVTGVEPGNEELTDGTYTVAGVAPGDYDVAFADPLCGDDGYAVTWYDGELVRADATAVSVVKGETTSGIDGVVLPLPSTSFVCPADDLERPVPFSDVPADNVHRNNIACMAEAMVVRGRADGTYGPAEPVRRGQLATLVASLLAQTQVELPSDPPDAFDDDNGSVHELAIDQVAALGLIGGKGERRFAPEDTVERGQLASIMVAAYERVTGFPLNRPAAGFDDDSGSVHEANIDKAALAGLVAGTSATSFEPRGAVRRDALATFVARVLDRTTRDTLGDGLLVGEPQGGVEQPVQGYGRLSVRP